MDILQAKNDFITPWDYEGTHVLTNILVTGGLGFIGHRVVAQLENAGHNLLVLDNMTDYKVIPHRELSILHDERKKLIKSLVYYWDVRSPSLDIILEKFKPEIIIHLASCPRQAVFNSNPILSSSIMSEGIINLCELSKQHNVKKVVYISSSMVYGNFVDLTNEDTPCNPIGQYGIMKLAGELLVKDYHNRGYFDYTILRPSAVYGPNDVTDRVIPKFFKAALKDETLYVPSLTECLDFTYVDDVVQGIVAASISNNANNKTYNITRGSSKTLYEAAKRITELVGKGRVEVNTEKMNGYPSRGSLNCIRAKNDFSFYPTVNLEQGLKRYYEHIQDSPLWIT